jgi:tetratricopeptide (TPR) repeat protein
MRQAKVDDAVEIYSQSIPKIWEYRAGANNHWRIIAEQTDIPSWNWAGAYLREYFYVRQTWFGWEHFTSGLFDTSEWQQIPFSCQSLLSSTSGWASVRRRSLREVISDQISFLADDRWRGTNTELVFLKSLHFMVLCYAHTLSFNQRKALVYAHSAIEMLDSETEPYYAIRAHDLLGTVFYTFGQYDQALQSYTRSKEIVQNVGQSAMPLTPYYGEGWAYIGKRELQKALDAFRDGYLLKYGYALHYDAARCKYGEGYTQFLQGNYEDALQTLYEALSIFCDDHFDLNSSSNQNSVVSPAMAAACSHVLAIVYEKQGNIKKALRHETQAVDWQREIEDPGQLSDMLRRAVKLNLQSFQFVDVLRYLFEFVRLRLRYRVPTICLN